MAMPRYPDERFVTLQEPIQRFHFAQGLGRERPAHVLMNEGSEPLPQSPSLICYLVKFARHRPRLQLIQCVCRHKFGLSQPPQEAISAIEPVDRRIDWCRDGVQEIEAGRAGDENCTRTVFHDWPLSQV